MSPKCFPNLRPQSRGSEVVLRGGYPGRRGCGPGHARYQNHRGIVRTSVPSTQATSPFSAACRRCVLRTPSTSDICGTAGGWRYAGRERRQWHARAGGKAKYTTWKLLGLAVDGGVLLSMCDGAGRNGNRRIAGSIVFNSG